MSDEINPQQTVSATRDALAKADETAHNAEALLKNLDEELMVLDREDAKITERASKEMSKVAQKLDLTTLQFLKNTTT